MPVARSAAGEGVEVLASPPSSGLSWLWSQTS